MATFTKEEVRKHNSKDDAWIIIENKVYDITPFIAEHPGGDAILRKVGDDTTDIFKEQPAHESVATYIGTKLEELYKGDLAH